MGVFKNSVGRPSNETVKKRNVFKILCLILFIVVIGLIAYILNVKGIIKTNNKVPEIEDNKNSVSTTKNEINNDIIITYEIEEYVKKDQNENIVAKSKRNIPKINNLDNNISEKIVNNLVKISDNYWKSIKSSSDDLTPEIINVSENLGVNLMFNTVKISNNYISFELVTSGNFGGISWSDINYIIVSTKTGELLKIDDIENETKKLSDLVYKISEDYIEKNVTIIDDNWKNKLKEVIFEYWNLDDEGLNISIPYVYFSTVSNGPIKIKIPYNTINDYLKDEYKLK